MKSKNQWTDTEDCYLAKNFNDAEMWRMTADLGRSRDAIYCRAKKLGLHRENRTTFKPGQTAIGTPFQPGNVPWNANPNGKPVLLRDKITALLATYQDQTIAQMVVATGSNAASCWRVCNKLRAQGNLHIAQYLPAPGNAEAVYRIGRGVDAIKPDPERVRPANEPDPYELVPVPRPQLGLWGCTWPTTTQQQEITA